MVADALTKDSADRTALAAIMDGSYKLNHSVHEYKEPAASATAASSSDLYADGGGGACGASPTAVLEGGSGLTAPRVSESIVCSTYTWDIFWTTTDFFFH